MNRERMERLLTLLERERNPETATVQFNMNTWIERLTCGTAACAAGLMMLDPWCNAEGLRGSGTPMWERDAGSDHPELGYRALAGFLGVDLDDAYNVFAPGQYSADPPITVEHVIERVKALLARGETP